MDTLLVGFGTVLVGLWAGAVLNALMMTAMAYWDRGDGAFRRTVEAGVAWLAVIALALSLIALGLPYGR